MFGAGSGSNFVSQNLKAVIVRHIAKRTFLSILMLAVFIQLTSCAKREQGNIHVISAKMAKGINEKYMPVDTTNIFPEGTIKVYCWFSWRDAEKNMEILAKWHYLTDDIPIVEYAFAIPRREGVGSVSLSMPEGKVLPPGLYRVELKFGNRALKSLTFKIAENKAPEAAAEPKEVVAPEAAATK